MSPRPSTTTTGTAPDGRAVGVVVITPRDRYGNRLGPGRGGDVGWYEGQYEVARLTQAMGKTQESCGQLEQLKPAMPGVSDADLRKQLDALYQQVCR